LQLLFFSFSLEISSREKLEEEERIKGLRKKEKNSLPLLDFVRWISMMAEPSRFEGFEKMRKCKFASFSKVFCLLSVVG